MTGTFDARQAPRKIAVSQIAVRGPALGMLADRSVEPSRSRIRPFDGSAAESDDLVAMATMVCHPDDAPLRLRNVVLDHEHGFYCSPKSPQPLVWQGEAHQEAIVAADVDPAVVAISTESRRFENFRRGTATVYTVDLVLRLADGRERFVEIKRDDRELEDPEYATTLSHVAEICRRCDKDFHVVLRSEIFLSDRHRRNAFLVASRGFATIGHEHRRRLDAHRRAVGAVTTIGALAAALEPGSAVLGEAVLHALVVDRKVSIDLAGRLLPSSTATLL